MDKNLEELLQICEQEKLHLSGAIQPFGALIVVDKKSTSITHVSANVSDFIDASPKELLGKNIKAIKLDIAQHLKPDKSIGSNEYHYNFLEHNKKTIDMLISVGENNYVVEFESSAAGVNRAIPNYNFQYELLNIPTSQNSLYTYHNLLVDSIAQVCGYDRVMLYRFHEDWSGEVVAEATTCDVGSYLGLRFPASDIPQIARNIYMLNPYRLIPDVSVIDVPIMGVDEKAPDLTYSDTRSVSLVHIEYLKNMGVSASFSIPIKVAGVLHGLVACHNLKPHFLSFDQRNSCVMLTKSYAIGISAYSASKRLNMIDGCERRINELAEGVAGGGDFLDGIQKYAQKMLELLGADGFVVVLRGDVFSLGVTPSEKTLSAMDSWFMNATKENIFMTDSLSEIEKSTFGATEICKDGICGMTALKIGASGGGTARFYWFRVEELKEITWAGNPNKPVVEKEDAIVLSPRRSFEKYSEIKRGYSRAWNNEDRMNVSRFRNTFLRWL